jgi:hypothetical protein
MADQHLRVLLKHAGDRDRRQSLHDRVHCVDHVGAHEAIELARRHQQPPIGVRASLNDGHVQAIFCVSAVRRRLIEPAMLRLGQPIGAVADFGRRLRRRRARQQPRACRENRPHARPFNGLCAAHDNLRLRPRMRQFQSKVRAVCKARERPDCRQGRRLARRATTGRDSARWSGD